MFIKKAILSVAIIITIFSCTKMLDVKSDKSLSTINSLTDIEKLLDDYFINTLFPNGTEVLADNYFLNYSDWSSLRSVVFRDYYIWKPTAENTQEWNVAYQYIYTCNLALESVDEKKWNKEEQRKAEIIKGRALFFRASYYYSLAQLHAKVYERNTAETDLGIVLRQSTDMNEKIVRANLQKTYDQIIDDFKMAINLLPETEAIKTRPVKSAAYGALARTYISMSEYENAQVYADSCLQSYNYLIDYNSLDPGSQTPISRFNEEVLFHATSFSSAPLSPKICKIDTILIDSYEENDLRKTILYSKNPDGTYGFKGDYDGSVNNGGGHSFTGITTSEQYLILAECYARKKNVEKALFYLNTLLSKRWKTNTFEKLENDNYETVLDYVLKERRKELVFRTLRFTDLRRLNLEPNRQVTLYRYFSNGESHVLLPNANAYTSLIPSPVILISGVTQNPI